jgi:RP/EB family microtubule-associated protein
LNYSGEPYNALERRKGCDLFYIMGGNKVAPPKKAGTAGISGPSGSTGKVYTGKSGAGAESSNTGPKKFSSAGATAASSGKVIELETQVIELKMNNDTLDREREFYFGKLRDIEEML